MSSMYTMRVSLVICSQNIVSIMVWKVASKLVSLKNITVGSKSPLFVTKAALCQSSSIICTILYPQQMSTTMINLALPILSISWGMSGKGY